MDGARPDEKDREVDGPVEDRAEGNFNLHANGGAVVD